MCALSGVFRPRSLPLLHCRHSQKYKHLLILNFALFTSLIIVDWLLCSMFGVPVEDATSMCIECYSLKGLSNQLNFSLRLIEGIEVLTKTFSLSN